jgi:hypothetical protein
MNPRDIIATALCGFDTQCKHTGDPKHLIGLTLEKAKHEAACLIIALDGSDDTLTAGSLEGRIDALSYFIDEYMDVTWRQPEAEKVDGTEPTEGSEVQS